MSGMMGKWVIPSLRLMDCFSIINNIDQHTQHKYPTYINLPKVLALSSIYGFFPFMIFPWHKPTIWGTPWLWKPSKKPTLPNINQLQNRPLPGRTSRSRPRKRRSTDWKKGSRRTTFFFFESEPGDQRIWIYWVQDGAPKIGVSCLVSGLITVYGR